MPRVASPLAAVRPAGGPIARLRGRLSPCAAKLEALPWAAALSFVAYGARIGVRVSDAAVLPEVVKRVPTGAVRTDDGTVDHLVSYVVGGQRPGERVRRFHALYAAAVRLQRTLHAAEALAALEQHLELAVAELAPRRLFVHAGVVGWNGRAILIPGRSLSGKSSLVAALLARGASYLSDEFAVVDGRGRMHPYPRPLSLRNADGSGVPTRADALGARTEDRPLPVGLVAVARYEAGARWAPRTLSPGHALLEMLSNSVTVRKRPEQSLAALERIALTAHSLKGKRGEAAETAELLIATVGETSR
jgi:hypothetical protein